MYMWIDIEDIKTREQVRKAINLSRVDSFQLYRDPTRGGFAVGAYFGDHKEILKRFEDYDEAEAWCREIVQKAEQWQ